MFLEVKIVDMADAQAKDHTGYFLVSEIIAVLPKQIDMNAHLRQTSGEKNIIPRMLPVTVIATRQGGQFVTREDIKDVMARIELAIKGGTGKIGLDDDVERLLSKIISEDREKTLAEIAVAFIRWSQDLKENR